MLNDGYRHERSASTKSMLDPLRIDRGEEVCMTSFSICDGRRAFHMGRSQSESAGGPYGSENAGMSSANYVRIIMAENLRFLKEGSSASR